MLGNKVFSGNFTTATTTANYYTKAPVHSKYLHDVYSSFAEAGATILLYFCRLNCFAFQHFFLVYSLRNFAASEYLYLTRCRSQRSYHGTDDFQMHFECSLSNDLFSILFSINRRDCHVIHRFSLRVKIENSCSPICSSTF